MVTSSTWTSLEPRMRRGVATLSTVKLSNGRLPTRAVSTLTSLAIDCYDLLTCGEELLGTTEE